MPPVGDRDDGDAGHRAALPATRARVSRTTSANRSAARPSHHAAQRRAVEGGGPVQHAGPAGGGPGASARRRASRRPARRRWSACSSWGRCCGTTTAGRRAAADLGERVLPGVGHHHVRAGEHRGRVVDPGAGVGAEHASSASPGVASLGEAYDRSRADVVRRPAEQQGDRRRPAARRAAPCDREAGQRAHRHAAGSRTSSGSPGSMPCAVGRPEADQGVGDAEARAGGRGRRDARAGPRRPTGTPCSRARSSDLDRDVDHDQVGRWRPRSMRETRGRPGAQAVVAERQPSAGGRAAVTSTGAAVVVAGQLRPSRRPASGRGRDESPVTRAVARSRAASARARWRWPRPTWWT